MVDVKSCLRFEALMEDKYVDLSPLLLDNDVQNWVS